MFNRVNFYYDDLNWKTVLQFICLFVKGFRYENFKKKHIKNPYILVHYVSI